MDRQVIVLKTDTPEYAGELSDEIRLFFGNAKIVSAEEEQDADYVICHTLTQNSGEWENACRIWQKGREIGCYTYAAPAVLDENPLEYKKQRKRGAKIAVFRCLGQISDAAVPWGSLTGVRPTKLYRETAQKIGAAEADRQMREVFDVSEEKLLLLKRIHAQQQEVFARQENGSIDVYVGIPFCTSKCSYCSFSSSLTTKTGERESEYVSALKREIERVRPVLTRYRVRCLYVGGGTPTALGKELLEDVLSELIPYRGKEYTVEAGRPDTIDKDMLRMLKSMGVNRISVNCQTTNSQTLRRIGRNHSPEDFFRAYEIAREAGFDAVNTDLILGLPGENGEQFLKSLSDVIALRPENITVHTLAIKRASAFGMANESAFLPAREAEQALRHSQAALQEAGYVPYYMYRQKYMTGNMENVGYTLPGKACEYNIDIMEETTSILALGAGGISKRVFGGENRIERAAAVKDISHYLARTEEMAERKLALFLP